MRKGGKKVLRIVSVFWLLQVNGCYGAIYDRDITIRAHFGRLSDRYVFSYRCIDLKWGDVINYGPTGTLL